MTVMDPKHTSKMLAAAYVHVSGYSANLIGEQLSFILSILTNTKLVF